MTNETIDTILTSLAERIKQQEARITLKDYEIAGLQKKLEDAEAIIRNNELRKKDEQ